MGSITVSLMPFVSRWEGVRCVRVLRAQRRGGGVCSADAAGSPGEWVWVQAVYLRQRQPPWGKWVSHRGLCAMHILSLLFFEVLIIDCSKPIQIIFWIFVNQLFMVPSNVFVSHDSDAPGHWNGCCEDGGWLFQLLFPGVMCRNVSMGNWKTDLHASPLSWLQKWDKVKARRGRENYTGSAHRG